MEHLWEGEWPGCREAMLRAVCSLLPLGYCKIRDPSIHPSIRPSVNQYINQSANQSINQSINQAINPSISWEIIHYPKHSLIHKYSLNHRVQSPGLKHTHDLVILIVPPGSLILVDGQVQHTGVHLRYRISHREGASKHFPLRIYGK